MVSESYPNFSVKIGDIYVLKDGVKVKENDVAVLTGIKINNKPEVDKMGAGYDPNNVIGTFCNSMDKLTIVPNEPYPYPYDEIVVLRRGAGYCIVTEAVEATDKLMGASNQIFETFDGDGSAQQQITVGNVPIASIVTVYENSGMTTLTQVPLTQTPSTDEYNYNPTTGVITIGGTSVSGTDNYEVTYTVDSGRMKKLIEEKSETITVTTNVGNATENIDLVLNVNATVGTSTGEKIIKYTGTPAAGEVVVDRAAGTLTFNGTDAITEADIIYKTGYKPKAEALEPKAAGELCRILIDTI